MWKGVKVYQYHHDWFNKEKNKRMCDMIWFAQERILTRLTLQKWSRFHIDDVNTFTWLYNTHIDTALEIIFYFKTCHNMDKLKYWL